MSLDPYQLCPCGSGKKVKFCCSKDILPEMEKLLRAVEGEQRVAALDQLNKLIDEKGARESLLALKAELQLMLGGTDEAVDTIAQFQKARPYNSLALSLSAIVAAANGDVEGAIEKLQRSLEYLDGSMLPTTYSAIGLVAQLLISTGEIMGGRGHLMMQAGFTGAKDTEVMQLLSRVNRSGAHPLLKDDPAYAECPADVPWAGEFSAAMKSARRGAWLAACESLDSLAEKVPDQPSILKNIAIFRGRLGQSSKAASAWRRYAALPDLPLDDAVEAEALAQVLEPVENEDTVDRVTVTYDVPDMNRLMEHLLSQNQVTRVGFNADELPEDEVPPKAAFHFLDRPLDDELEDLSRDEIPRVFGNLLTYGKQTDREARIEFQVVRDDDFHRKTSAFSELVGDLVSGDGTQETTGTVPSLSHVMSWRWRIPQGVSNIRRAELVREHRDDVGLNHWPELPLPQLDGKRPVDVADDPEYRIRLLAAILVFELEVTQSPTDFDFNRLREKLGLPRAEPISGENVELSNVPVARLFRLDPKSVETEKLVRLFQLAVSKAQSLPAWNLGRELLDRPDTPPDFGKEIIYEALLNTCEDYELALKIIDEGRQYAISQNQSPAEWLLSEFPIRLIKGDKQRVQEIFTTLQTRHINEPGVSDRLYELLARMGLLSPAGEPAQQGEAAASAEPSKADAAGLWTPDGGSEPAQGGQKSKLWVPGMD